MKTKTTNEAPQAATPASPHKLPYTRPLLRVYGAVHQFTQGSGQTNNDGGGVMTKVATPSDRAYKTNLARIGTHPLGIGLYLFDYKPEFQESSGFGRQFGVMADEVETVLREAVVTDVDGLKRVNYAMLGIDVAVRRMH